MLIGELAESDTAPYWVKGSHAPYVTVSSHDWRSIEAILDSLPDGRTVTFGVGVQGAGATLRVANPVLFGMAERPGFRMGRLSLMVAWGLAALWIGTSAYRGLGSAPARSALASLVGVAAAGLLMPESVGSYAGLPRSDATETIGHASLFFPLTLTRVCGRW